MKVIASLKTKSCADYNSETDRIRGMIIDFVEDCLDINTESCGVIMRDSLNPQLRASLDAIDELFNTDKK